MDVTILKNKRSFDFLKEKICRSQRFFYGAYPRSMRIIWPDDRVPNISQCTNIYFKSTHHRKRYKVPSHNNTYIIFKNNLIGIKICKDN